MTEKVVIYYCGLVDWDGDGTTDTPRFTDEDQPLIEVIDHEG